MSGRDCVALLVAAAGVQSAGVAAAQSFVGFSDILGDGAAWTAIDVSDDGQSAVIGGSRAIPGSAAVDRIGVVWRSGAGFTPIPSQTPQTPRTISVEAISGNGATVVYGDAGSAYAWSEGLGTQLTPDSRSYRVRDIDQSGTRFTGQVLFADPLSFRTYNPAARWTSGGEVQFLTTTINRSEYATDASGISRNGEWVAGRHLSPSLSANRASLWGPDGSWIDISDSIHPTLPSNAYTVSNDGSTAFGGVFEGGRGRAWRWEQGVGATVLEFLSPSHDDMSLVEATADGGVAVGRSGILGSEVVAVIWDEINGTRSVEDLAVNQLGIDLQGWTLTSALAISADGSVIAGSGIDPNGNQGTWIIQVPSPPAGMALVVSAGLLTSRRRR